MSPPLTPYAVRKIEYLTLLNEELKSVIKQILIIYPVLDWPDDDDHKIIKHSLSRNNLLTEPQPVLLEFTCSVCGCEITKTLSRGAHPRCKSCYLTWKKSQRTRKGRE